MLVFASLAGYEIYFLARFFFTCSLLANLLAGYLCLGRLVVEQRTR